MGLPGSSGQRSIKEEWEFMKLSKLSDINGYASAADSAQQPQNQASSDEQIR